MSARQPEFIQLEKGDDINSIRDRLSFIRGQRVLLIWPEEGTLLTRKLDLVLIQREAMRRAIRLALVTHDPQVIKQATELNISTFETIGASERGRWKRGRAKVFVGREKRPPEIAPTEELKEVASRVRNTEEEREPRRGGGWLLRIVGALLLLGLVLGGSYVVVPGATVSITLAQSIIETEAQIVADPTATSVDVENGIIPAITLRVEIEETGTIETTGTQAVDDVLSVGSVVFINQTDDEIVIPDGTTVSTSAGTPILFQTTAEAVMPAGVGNQMEVPVEALPSSAGSVGNVDSGLINTVIGALTEDLTVRNLAPTSGGANRDLGAVSAEDRDRLLAMVRQQLQSRAYTEMLPRLTATQTIIIETVNIAEERDEWTTFNAEVGDTEDNLSLTMRAIVEAVAIDELFARQIAIARLSSQVPRGQLMQAESVTFEVGPVLSIDTQGRVTFSITGSSMVVGQADVELLRERLAGRTLDEARQYLLNEVDVADNAPPQIIVSPDWLTTMPLLPQRIEIVVVESAP